MKKVIALAGMLCSSIALAGPGDQVTYPEGYKDNYTPYLSLNRTRNDDQYIRLFINDTGLSGTEANGQLPYGSKIVAEIYKVVKDADGKVVTSSLGQRIPKKFAAIAVMERRKGAAAEYPEGLGNDDWDFAVFKPDGKRADKDLLKCASCHAPYKETHYLFSYEHIIAEQKLK